MSVPTEHRKIGSARPVQSAIFIIGSLVIARIFKSPSGAHRFRMVFAWIVNCWVLVYITCLAIIAGVVLHLLEYRTDMYRHLGAYFGIADRVEMGWASVSGAPPTHRVEEFDVSAHDQLESHEIRKNVGRFVTLAKLGKPRFVRQAGFASLMALRDLKETSNVDDELTKLAIEFAGEEFVDFDAAVAWFDSVEDKAEWQPLPLVRIEKTRR